MAEVAPAPAAAPAKAAKKKATPRPKKSGPSVSEMIVQAVSASQERNGVSAAALKKCGWWQAECVECVNVALTDAMKEQFLNCTQNPIIKKHFML